jgi:F-type H+-transporting ATPase subunit delta
MAHHPTVFDTDKQYLGAVYANALLGASEKAGNTDAVLEELNSLVADVMAEMPEWEAVLSAPRVPLEVKERMLDSAFAGKMSTELLNFLKVVTRRGRFTCLRAIANSAQQQYNELRGRVHVQVRSAAELDQATTSLVADKLRAALGMEIDLELQIDPDLIGGLVVRVGDTVYDASVANRLRRLRDELLNTSSQQIRDNQERFAVAP